MTPEECRRWIAASLAQEAKSDVGTQGSVHSLIEIARDEGVAALLLEALTNSGPADDATNVELLAPLARVVKDEILLELLRQAEFGRVCTRLRASDFQFLVLKGSALAARIYAFPHYRPRVDLDLLFPSPESVEQAHACLEGLGYRATGAKVGSPISNQLVLERNGPAGATFWIDAHWRLANNAAFADRFSFAELEQHAVDLSMGAVQARGLGNAHALIHAAIHRVVNLPSGTGDRLIWLYDFKLLALCFSPEDWALLVKECAEKEVSGIVLGALQAMREVGGLFPGFVAKELANAATREPFNVRKATSRRYQEWQAFRSVPVIRRPKWIWGKLFPDTSYMARWDEVGQEKVAFLTYARRFRNGLRLLMRRSDGE